MRGEGNSGTQTRRNTRAVSSSVTPPLRRHLREAVTRQQPVQKTRGPGQEQKLCAAGTRPAEGHPQGHPELQLQARWPGGRAWERTAGRA